MYSRPVLSFCIPTYNRAERVLHCVEHILQYQGDEIEVVVSNNASTDNTLELLSAINDKRLTVFTNETNISVNNWPLAVSRAEGFFAALMSDEDVVCLENIDYFIELLSSDNVFNSDIGLIIYDNRAAVRIFSDYAAKNIPESVLLALKYCGHISGSIQRMDHERDFFYKPERFNGNEHQYFMDVQKALLCRAMLTSRTLCYAGKPNMEKVESRVGNIDIEKYQKEQIWAGRGFAQTRAIFKYQTSVCVAELTKPEQSVALFESLRFTMWRSVWFYECVEGGVTDSVQELWVRAREVIDCSIDGISKQMDEWFRGYTSYLSNVTDNSSWHNLNNLFSDFIQRRYDAPVTNNLDAFSQMSMGEVMFTVNHSLSQLEAFGKENLLEINDTGAMIALLSAKDYEGVMNYKELKTPRAQYLRGQALYKLGNLEMAETSFLWFIDRVTNPACIGDMVTGIYTVMYAYYYLGCVYQEKKEHGKAVECFAKCQEMKETYMLGENLASSKIYI